MPADTTSIGQETLATRVAGFARRSPGGMAIEAGPRRVSWRELDDDANVIARAIEAATKGRLCNVVVLLRDRVEALRAIVGVARSGCTYVPLDPNDPDERLRFALADCAAALVLSGGDDIARVRALAPPGAGVVDVVALEGDPVSRAAMTRVPGANAHICYTSGSTGQPKGVCQSHANLLHFFDAYQRRLGVGETDRLSLLYPVCFGAGLGNVYRGLALGATLCLYDVRQDGMAGLSEWVDRERITLLHTFPMVFREMAKRMHRGAVLRHLRVLHLDSESLFAGDVALYRSLTGPHCKLVHQLSATEVSLIAQNVLEHHTAVPDEPVVPVGRAFEGVRIEIRRDDGGAAATDEIGKIFVSSRFLSPGYWNRPELDARAFSADAEDPLGRTYRTGDLGRVDGNGMLHYLGREGTRVKIRGHTVEMGEVEAALVGLDDVVGAAVATEDEREGSDSPRLRLVAWVELREQADRDARALRRMLVRKLPAHMVPAEIRFVLALPHTPSGKVDRTRLAAATILPAHVAEYAAPQGATEVAVAHMFSTLLACDRVGRDDDFFLSGGDSLKTADLQASIEEAFGVRVTGFHEDATVAGIAATIRTALAARGPRIDRLPMLMPLWKDGSALPLFMVHGRHGQAFVSPHFRDALGGDQPVWAFQARGLDGHSPPHASVEAMVDDYLAELRKVRGAGPYMLGGLCVGSYVAAAIARRLRADGETVLPLLLLDPPNRVKARVAAHADPEHVRGKMLARRAQGRLDVAVENPELLAHSVRVAAAFDDAIARYVPVPYQGPVYVLSSRHRMHMGDPLELRRYFTGRVKRYEVGDSHGEVLDARSPLFARTLRRCVELIQAAAPPRSLMPAPVAAKASP